MVIAWFQIDDEDQNSRFYEDIFLLADIIMDVVLFLFLSNDEVKFYDWQIK